MRLAALAEAALAALVLGGCGGLSHTVDRDLLRDVTIENKLQLFDAENEVSIAVDESEQVQRRLRTLRAQMGEMREQLKSYDADIERAKTKKDAKAQEIATLARGVGEKKIDYLESSIALVRDQLEAQELLVRVAEAKFELAKASLIKKNNVRGAAKIDVEVFEKQVDGAVNKAKEAQKELAEPEKEVATAKAEWLTGRAALEKASGGGVGSPWAEVDDVGGESW
jgi:chromosome segregation ATPase